MKERVADFATQPLITTCSIFEQVASLKFVIEIFVVLIRRDTIFSWSFDCNPWLKAKNMLQYSCKKNSFGKPVGQRTFFCYNIHIERTCSSQLWQWQVLFLFEGLPYLVSPLFSFSNIQEDDKHERKTIF